MANRYWVGGTGTWDNSTITNWSTSSGGASGASVPISSDVAIFDAGSGTNTITTNYDPSVSTLTMATGFTGTLTLGAAMTVANTFTIGNSGSSASTAAGTFNAVTFNVTCKVLSSSNSNTRTINMGTGTWDITGDSATVISMLGMTNATLNPSSSTIRLTSSATTGLRIINASGVAFPYNHFKVIAGSDTIQCSAAALACNDLDFTGFTGIMNFASHTVTGSYTLDPGMTVTTNTNALTLAATSSKNIDTHGIEINRPITMNGVSGSWTLLSDLNMDGDSFRQITLTNGSFDANDFNVTCGSFSSSNSNTRTVSMGSGTFTLIGTGTVWNTGTTTSLTFNKETSTIVVDDTSAVSKTFTGGGLTYYNLSITGNGSAAVIFQNNNTWNDFTINAPNTVTFTASSTNTFANFYAAGTFGNAITIQSTSSTNHTLSKSSGTVTGDYLRISDSTATGGASWFAGDNSTDLGGGNSGWLFTAPATSGQYFGDTTIKADVVSEVTTDAGVTVDGLLIKDGDISIAPTISSGSGAPGSTPAKVGNIYVDTSGKKMYIATGTTNSGDWTITN